MSLPVVLRREARAEFDEAADRYEQDREGLGEEFIDEVEAVFRRIGAMPEMHRVVSDGIRRAGLRRFPYSVLYRVEPAQVVVLAVFHASRDPGVWRSRA